MTRAADSLELPLRSAIFRRGLTLRPIPPKIEAVHCYGRVAQLGEHLLCKQGVAGSIPVTSTNSLRRNFWSWKHLQRESECDGRSCKKFLAY